MTGGGQRPPLAERAMIAFRWLFTVAMAAVLVLQWGIALYGLATGRRDYLIASGLLVMPFLIAWILFTISIVPFTRDRLILAAVPLAAEAALMLL